ncbi:MAG: TIGR01244 family sulfur transferase [Devosia sp.]|jgi:uncharacterized protein (TIGR01244 family)
MWPSRRSQQREKTDYRQIAPNFAVAGQVTPGQIESVAAAGFKTIVCARPDGEEPGQPSFATIERAAKEAGLRAVYIPVSGAVGEGALIRMEDTLKNMPGPMFGYCRSGARAASLYGAARQAMNR